MLHFGHQYSTVVTNISSWLLEPFYMYIMANIIHLQALIFPLKVIQNIETKAALLEYLKYNLGIKYLLC